MDGAPRPTCTISTPAPGDSFRTILGTSPRRAPVLLAALLTGGVLHAQAPPASAALTARLAAIAAPIGYESALADTLLGLLPGARRDRAGNAVLVRGSGTPRRLIACQLDEPGWIVGSIRPDGWLTVRRLPGRVPPLFDQQVEGQQVSLLGDRGPVPGVVGVRSVHLTRGRTTGEAPFTSDDAYVDVGARSAEEARALGIRETTPFVLAKRLHRYGDSLLAAPVAGMRAGCAALTAAASARPARGSVTLAFVVEQGLSARGLLTAVNTGGPFEEVVLLDTGNDAGVAVRPDSTLSNAASAPVSRWRLGVRHAGTPVETVSLGGVTALERRVAAWIGGGR